MTTILANAILKNEIVQDFDQLGLFLQSKSLEIKEEISAASIVNPWFTIENCELAIDSIANLVRQKNLENWLSKYPLLPVSPTNQKKIGLILAGNIPLVGFHDVLSVLVAGHIAMIKLSSQDSVLTKFVLNKLIQINPAWQSRIEIVERLAGFDAVIATGSNNTARYFDYYFGKYPHVIRKNRNSIAILNGEETKEDLENLCSDIFTYFGLGCRSVSKIYVPEGYNFSSLFEASQKYVNVDSHFKYKNNYDYNRTVLLMNNATHLANEFLSIAENVAFQSPISVLHYQYYSDLTILEKELDLEKDKLQCIVSNQKTIFDSIPFGIAQRLGLFDYADNIDILEFLQKLVETQKEV